MGPLVQSRAFDAGRSTPRDAGAFPVRPGIISQPTENTGKPPKRAAKQKGKKGPLETSAERAGATAA
ncbi:hypothetical protein NL676_009159 [Syzygium grande]|nr:hypothetical protein NL676_009159 [Syzygium grande]